MNPNFVALNQKQDLFTKIDKTNKEIKENTINCFRAASAATCWPLVSKQAFFEKNGKNEFTCEGFQDVYLIRKQGKGMLYP